MPIFFPIIPMLIAQSFFHRADAGCRFLFTAQRTVVNELKLYFHINAGRQVEFHQRIDGLRGGVQDVQKTLMRPDLELLPGLFVHVGRTEHSPAIDLCRMANRSSLSMAIGVMSSTLQLMLSPGITISTPSARVTTPVTSVVRK